MDSINKTGRTAGAFYLLFIVTMILASTMRGRVIINGDPLTTIQNLSASQGLFMLSFGTELLSSVFFLLAAWGLYGLLKPVNANLALLFLLLNLGGVAVQSLNQSNQIAALLVLNGASDPIGFQADQRQALTMLFINLYQHGFMISQVFYSTWLLPLGYLIYRSGFLPKLLGILVMLDFFGVLVWFIQFFFFPNVGVISIPGLAISFVAEFSLSLWLLIMGIRQQQPVLVEAIE